MDDAATGLIIVEADDASTPLILNAATPTRSARELLRRRFMHDGRRTIVHSQDQFYVWHGSHYAALSEEQIRATVYDFLDGAQQMKDNKLLPFAPTLRKVAEVIGALAAAVQLGDGLHPPCWLGDPGNKPPARELLAFGNGLLHLPTRQLIPHTPAFFNVNALAFAYQPDAAAPEAWFTFLAQLWPDDDASIDTLQEWFGLLLTPETRYQKMLLVFGPGRSGKGTIGRVLTALVGRDNVRSPTLNSLATNFGLATLIDKPLAIVSDARLSGRADVATIVERLLSISGEDDLTIDRKYQAAWTGRLPTRFIVMSNELPKFNDASGVIATRFIVLALTRSFYGREDLGLTNRLLGELPSILLWAVAGLERLTERGYFIQPASGCGVADELASLASAIREFIKDRCVIGEKYAVEIDRLFRVWQSWCEENGREHPGTKQTFGRDLRAAVPGLNEERPRVGGARPRAYEGIRLAFQTEEARAAAPPSP